ncbi:MAG: lysoplasmalogenase [Mycobacteriales bacterium]
MRTSRLYAGLAAVDVLLAATGRERPRRLTKPLLMPALMVGKDRPTQVALGLSGAGDVALLGRSEAAFTAGLGSFLAAHAAWVVTLRGRGGGGLLAHRPWVALPYVGAWAGLNRYLWPRTGKDRLPVLVYSTALLATALAAVDTGRPRTAAGGTLFLASDALLALERFAGVELPAHEGLVMATYTAAQALLADSS